MHAIVKGALATAFVVAAAAALERAMPGREARPEPGGITSSVADPRADASLRPCAAGAIANGQRVSSRDCVPLPPGGDELRSARERLLAETLPTLADARGSARDSVTLMPDRSADFARYLLPVTPAQVEPAPADGSESGNFGEHLLVITTDPGAVVTAVDLEAQQGAAEVVGVGELFGITVVTRHLVLRPSGARSYLAFVGKLARPGPGVVVGAELGTLGVLGFAGSSGSIRFALRELRGPLASPPAHLADLASEGYGFAIDARNLLPRAP
ncbi:MAG: hypothetical protein EXR75_15950 [Myxococcales bacterium]|nr:hypothetical protein [Myxococcales bacterium]